MSAGFTGWAIEALIASSILMAFVLLARKEAQQALGPQMAYWLWALPALRMAMPPLPASWRESAAAPLTAASETVLVLFEPIVHPVAQAAAGDPFPWLLAVTSAWVLGAIGFFAWHGLAHRNYVRRLVSPPARHAQLPDGITLVESDQAVGPVAFGVLKRFVAVPSDFAERYDADERKLALAHELGHHARGDLIANWIALTMLAVHWFNPLAWVAYRKFRADQEMANDARVLAKLPLMERHAYACAIVKAAHGRAITAACHLHTIEDLKGRLRMLKMSRKSRRVAVAGAVGIASLTVAGLGLTASGAAAEKIRTVAETQVVEMTQAAVPPTTPSPPSTDAWPEPASPGTTSKKKIVIVSDGETKTYEGAEAEAYMAAHPEIARNAELGRDVARTMRRHRIVIRDKDGKTRTYEGAEADAYLKAHPDMRPPVPPVPPVPVGVTLVGPDVPVVITMNEDGKRVVKRVHRGQGPTRVFAMNGPEVVTGDCRGDKGGFVRNETRKDGQPRIVICERRIERFAANQARAATDYARLGELASGIAVAELRNSKHSALSGLEAGRAAVMASRDMSEADRAQALAGIDKARAELEREMRVAKPD